jgi:hypothetical protein
LAHKVGRTVHTIRKWEKLGLRVIKRGNLRLYPDEDTPPVSLGRSDGRRAAPPRPAAQACGLRWHAGFPAAPGRRPGAARCRWFWARTICK